MRDVRGVCSAAAVVAAVMTAGVEARGQTADDQARAHFQRGNALAEVHRWSDAVAEYEAARALRPVPPVLYNLGLAYRALGRRRDAVASFRQYLATGTTAQRVDAERLVAALESELARVAVVVTPATARVSVDGAAVEGGARDVALDPGTHVFVAEAPGYARLERSVTLAVAARERVELVLAPETAGGAPAVPEARGALVVRRRVDGPGAGPFVLAGVGVAGFGAAVAFGLAQRAALDEFFGRNGCGQANGAWQCPVASPMGDARYDTAVTMTVLTNVALGVGVAGVASGVLWWLLAPRGERARAASAPSVSFTASGGGALVTVGGAL